MFSVCFFNRGDGRVSFGFSLLRGKRMTMEDFYDAQVKEEEKKQTREDRRECIRVESLVFWRGFRGWFDWLLGFCGIG